MYMWWREKHRQENVYLHFTFSELLHGMYVFKLSIRDAHRNLDDGGTVHCNKDQKYQWQCPVSTLASYELKEILQSKTAGVDSCPMANWWLCDLLPDFHYFSCRCRPAITTIVTWWSQISLQVENALRVEKLSKSGFLNNRLEFEKSNFLPFCSVTLS